MRKDLARQLYRIIDANGNRALEGLRVCEDLCRFVFHLRVATRSYKDLRHQVSACLARLDMAQRVSARSATDDIGQATSRKELARKTVEDLFYANAQRVKESLRVLEECAKLFDRSLSEEWKVLRYRFYSLEQKTIQRFTGPEK